MNLKRVAFLFALATPAVCFADFSASLFAPQMQQQKSGGDRVAICTTRVNITQPAAAGAVPVVEVTFLFDARKRTRSTYTTIDSITITESRYAGYLIAKGQASVDNPGRKGSVLVNVKLSPSSGIDFAFFEKTVSETQNVVGYYVTLVHNGKVLDSKFWEKDASVKRLKKEFNLPEKWWQ